MGARYPWWRAGERQTVRSVLVQLEQSHPEDAEMLIPLVPFFGRWDDILVFRTKEMREKVYSVMAEALDDPNTAGLVAKWMPRKGMIALELEAFLGLRPTAENFQYTEGKAFPGKAYRRKLVELTNVVEQQMCSKKWDDIVFDHVPSLASARYQKAFNKRCAERYKTYKEGLVKGTNKVNASALFPYDVIKSIVQGGDKTVATAQWNALPNFLGDESILAMVDVSGSMSCHAGGHNSKSVVSCRDVSTSLGLYVADKAKGPFKDCVLTFSHKSKIKVLTGDIVSKHKQLMNDMEWGNTNVISGFDAILEVGKKHGVADADMPKILLILSDMEFDSCVEGGKDKRALVAAKERYEAAGYTMPRVVFWNLNARTGNSPVTCREDGTALISGFSPAIMKSVLQASFDNFTPLSVMMETIGNPRYDVIDKAETTSFRVAAQMKPTVVKKKKTKEPVSENWSA